MDAKDLNTSKIGLYPVHRHMLPAKEFSIFSTVSFPEFINEYMFMIIPEEQYPHWLPFPSANFFCKG